MFWRKKSWEYDPSTTKPTMKYRTECLGFGLLHCRVLHGIRNATGRIRQNLGAVMVREPQTSINKISQGGLA